MGTLTPNFQKFRSEIHEVNVSGARLPYRTQKEGRSGSASVKKRPPKSSRRQAEASHGVRWNTHLLRMRQTRDSSHQPHGSSTRTDGQLSSFTQLGICACCRRMRHSGAPP